MVFAREPPVITDESESSIYRSATIWLELKGERAVDEGGQLMREARRRGDPRSADLWARIIAAVEDLRSRAEPDRAA